MRLSPFSRLASFATGSHRAIAQYLSIALAAASIDWLTKFIVVGAFGEGGSRPLWDRVSLLVTYNLGSAGGLTVGAYTWHLNVLVTGFALALITTVVKQLSLVDPRSARALGLVAGGAMGNMASMLFGPEGVADFLAVRINADTTIVMNFADAFLWTGALMLIPVVMRLLQAIRAERRPASVLAKA